MKLAGITGMAALFRAILVNRGILGGIANRRPTGLAYIFSNLNIGPAFNINIMGPVVTAGGNRSFNFLLQVFEDSLKLSLRFLILSFKGPAILLPLSGFFLLQSGSGF